MARYRRSIGNPFSLSGRNSSKKTTPTIPSLKSIDRLTLEDLKKIKAAISAYKTKSTEVNAKNDQIRKLNSVEREEFEKIQSARNEEHLRYQKTQIEPLKAEIERIKSNLYFNHQSGLVSSWISETMEFNGRKYNIAAKPFIEDLKRKQYLLDASIKASPALINNHDYQARKLLPQPNNYADLLVAGARQRVKFNDINESELDRLIQACLIHNENKKEEINQLRARASKAEQEIRAMAGPYKRDLDAQLQKLKSCPYCAGALSSDNAHLDHIYPVAKGGHSVRRNLVFVCASCNLKKKDFTLRVFITQAKLDATKVYERLDLLGKDA